MHSHHRPAARLKGKKKLAPLCARSRPGPAPPRDPQHNPLMVTEVPHVTHTAFIQFVDASFRPRAVCYFKARPGAPAADLAAGGCVTSDTDAPDTPSTPTSTPGSTETPTPPPPLPVDPQ